MDAHPLAAPLSRYEEIRGYVMCCGSTRGRGRPGQVLIRRQGMAAWLHNCLRDDRQPIRRATAATPVASRLAQGDVTAQIVTIMTTMALTRKTGVYT